MAKQLKIWNGRGHGKYNRNHIYVAAYSAKQACELIGQVCELGRPLPASEITKYYSKDCWGNSMDGITATEPCVYVGDGYDYNNKPIRII